MDSLRSLRERWTVGRRMDGARAESGISVAGKGEDHVNPQFPPRFSIAFRSSEAVSSLSGLP